LNHEISQDILIDRLGKHIDDAGVIRLILAYLTAGIMDGGVVVDRHLGTPQGGPLSQYSYADLTQQAPTRASVS
jgi:retron-type reverse transcriptase